MNRLIFLFIFYPFINFAQQENKNSYVGYITTENKQTITYQIVFEIQIDNSITGESITDIYGKDKTKSIITGNYNAQKNTLSFKEIQNSTTKSKALKEEFCFIESQDLQLKKIGDKEILTGKFNGRLPNGRLCAKGKIFLTSKENSIIEPINKSSLDSILNAKLTFKTLVANNSISIPWKSKTLNFYVWDGSNEDNDVISIYYNNTLIRENITLKNKKERITIPITSNSESKLKIQAVSLGKEGKNTVNLLFVDNETIYPFISILIQGESVIFDLK
jgi:hypothetical protein